MIILIIMVLILFGLLTVFIVKKNQYPAVYINSDNDLIYLKDEEETILASDVTLEDVSFIMQGKYVVYQNDNNLILANNNRNKIIEKSVLSYEVIDDRYLLILTGTRELITYDASRNKKISITSNVDNIIYSDEKQVLFTKDNIIFASKLTKSKITEVANSYNAETVTDSVLNGKYLYLINKESDLLKINIKNNKSKTLKKNIKEIYFDEDTNNLFALSNNGELYYIKNDEANKVTTGVLEVNSSNVSDSITFIKEDGFYFTNKTNITKLDDSYTDIYKSEILTKNKLYYIKSNSLNYIVIKNQKKVQDTLIDDIYVNTLNKTKDGYVYISLDEELKYLKEDKSKVIDSEVESQELVVGRSGKEIFYTKMIDGINNLYRYNFMKTKKIDSNIYKFVYIKQGLVYYLKNYDEPTNTYMLYKYTTKSKKIVDNAKNILDINYKYE